MPAPTADAAPDAAEIAALGPAGRVLVEALLSRYDFTPIEARVLVEAAHAADALATVRAAEQPDSSRQRLEMAWSKHYAALLGQLHLERS